MKCNKLSLSPKQRSTSLELVDPARNERIYLSDSFRADHHSDERNEDRAKRTLEQRQTFTVGPCVVVMQTVCIVMHL